MTTLAKNTNCRMVYSDFYEQYIVLVRKPGTSGVSVPHHYDTKEEADEAMEQLSDRKKYWWED